MALRLHLELLDLQCPPNQSGIIITRDAFHRPD